MHAVGTHSEKCSLVPLHSKSPGTPTFQMLDVLHGSSDFYNEALCAWLTIGVGVAWQDANADQGIDFTTWTFPAY